LKTQTCSAKSSNPWAVDEALHPLASKRNNALLARALMAGLMFKAHDLRCPVVWWMLVVFTGQRITRQLNC
jgi:hypothetical protein